MSVVFFFVFFFFFFVFCFFLFLSLSSFVEISELKTNSIEPDETPRFAASDLSLLCLHMSLLWDARHKLFNCVLYSFVLV